MSVQSKTAAFFLGEKKKKKNFPSSFLFISRREPWVLYQSGAHSSDVNKRIKNGVDLYNE